MKMRVFAFVLALLMCIAVFASCKENKNPNIETNENGETLIPVHECDFSDWGHTLEQHWKICSVCQEAQSAEKENHSFVNDICTACGYKLIKLEKVDETGVPTDKGIFVQLGSYPQTQVDTVKEKDLINSLNASAKEISGADAPNGWKPCEKDASNTEDIMWYLDVEADGSLYRGIYFSKPKNAITVTGSFGEPLETQKINGFSAENVYWFKFEPILWKIFDNNDGSATLISNLILDGKEFFDGYASSSSTQYLNNYAESSVRKWLNKNFLETAFNEFELDLLMLSTVDNSAETTGSSSNTYACANTEDRVYLLSNKDLAVDYKLDTNAKRIKQASDYAKCQGVQLDGNLKNGIYWLRSPVSLTNGDRSAQAVDFNGGKNQSIVYLPMGVCPVVKVVYSK